MNGDGSLLLAFARHCAVVAVGDRGLIASLFLTGLVGSVTHCAGMCGPFVLSQVAARLETIPARSMSEWHRLSGAALAPYHLGRLTTYTALGVVAAALAGSVGTIAGLRWLSAALLVTAAVLLAAYAVPGLKAALRLGAGSASGSGWLNRLAAPLFKAPIGGRGYLLGVLLGFIPCGLVYGALAAAAATRDPVGGGLAMAAFALGTVPTLFGIGLAGHMAGARIRPWVAKGAPLLLILNALVLTWMAWTLVSAPI